MKRFIIFCAMAALYSATSIAAAVSTEAECTIDICVAPDVTVDCISCNSEFSYELMFIGEKRTLTRRFHSTGGSGMNVSYAWSIASDNLPVATVLNNSAKKAMYGPANIASLPNTNTGGSYSTTFSGSGPSYQTGHQYTELRSQVQANGAGNATIIYTLTVTGYSF